MKIRRRALTLGCEECEFFGRTVTLIGTSEESDMLSIYLGRMVQMIIAKNNVEYKDIEQ